MHILFFSLLFFLLLGTFRSTAEAAALPSLKMLSTPS